MKTSGNSLVVETRKLTLTLIDSVHSTGNKFSKIMFRCYSIIATSLNLILQNHEIVMTTCGRYGGVRLAGNRS